MSVHPDVGRRCALKKLTGNAKTDCYVVGTTDEFNYVEIESILIVDSTAAVNTAVTVNVTIAGVEYVLAASLPVETTYPRFIAMHSLPLYRGDKISVTGANGHHVFVSYVPLIGGGAQALDRPRQQLGAVPGSDDQGDELERQGYQRAAEPGPWRAPWIRGRRLAIDQLRRIGRGRRRGRAVVVKPEERQQVGEDDRDQQDAEQAAEQRIEPPAHQPMSRASNR